jgi:presenilin-like A22 family membrane protease
MKYSMLTLTIIITLFLIAEVFGLFVSSHFLFNELPYGLQPPQMQSDISPFFFIGAIVMAAAVFMFFQKFKFDFLLKVWFFVAVLTCISISLSVFIDSWMAFIVALAITVMKFKEKDVYVHNLGEILLYGGVVALFAPVLNITSVIILILAIAIYDFIAVNLTKHMVKLAKTQQALGIFTGIIVINKNEAAILGGGDIAFTLLFATVALKDIGLPSAMFAIYGAAIALIILMMQGKRKKFYPAMPFIAAGLLLGLLVSILI